MSKKKIMALMLTMATTISMLAGCGQDAGESTDNTAEAVTGTEQTGQEEPGNGEKTVVTFGAASVSPEELEMRNRQIEAFNEKYPDIEVVIQTVTGDYMQWLQTSVASGTEPDVVSLGVLETHACYEAGLLEPLTPYVEEYGTDIEDFEQSILSSYYFEDQLYGLPRDFNTLVMFYNEDMLNEAGVSVPTTWDELTEAAEKLNTEDVSALCLANDVARFDPFIRMAGGQITDENGNPTFASEENAKGLGFYYSFLQNGTAKTPADLGVGWNAEAFAQEKAAIIIEGGWAVPFLQETAPDLNWKMAQLPAGPEGQATLSFDGVLCITANSKVKDAAYKLVEFMTGPEAQQIMVDTGLAIPTRKSINAGYLEKFPERAALIESADFSSAWYYGPYTPSINTALNHAGEALSTGTVSDPMEALETYEQEVETE